MIFVKNDYHLYIGRGRNKSFTFDIPIDLSFTSSATCVMGVKRNPDDAEPIFMRTATPSVSEYTCTFTLRPSDTEDLEPGTYFYDVALYTGTSTGYYTVVQGSLLDVGWVGTMMSDSGWNSSSSDTDDDDDDDDDPIIITDPMFNENYVDQDGGSWQIGKAAYTGYSLYIPGMLMNPLLNYVTYSTTSVTDVGTYTIRCNLRDTSKYVWTDGTTSEKTLTLTVYSSTVISAIKPTFNTSYVSVGTSDTSFGVATTWSSSVSLSSYIVNNNSSGVSITYEYSSTGTSDTFEETYGSRWLNVAGYYRITCSVNTEYYQWSDGTTADYVLTLYRPASSTVTSVTKPTFMSGYRYNDSATTGQIYYNGYAQTVSNFLDNWDSSGIITISPATVTNVSSTPYTITLSLTDTSSYKWADGTTADYTLLLYVVQSSGTKTQIALPTFNTSNVTTTSSTSATINSGNESLTFNNFVNYDSSILQDVYVIGPSGDRLSFTQSTPDTDGSYTITITPYDTTNYEYTDGSSSITLTLVRGSASTVVLLTKPTFLSAYQLSENYPNIGRVFYSYAGNYYPANYMQDFDSSLMTIAQYSEGGSGTGLTYVTTPSGSSYTFRITLDDPTNYHWADGTTDAYYVYFILSESSSKTAVSLPTFNTTYVSVSSDSTVGVLKSGYESITFSDLIDVDSVSQSVSIDGPDEISRSFSRDSCDTVGTYSIYISLDDTTNYEYTDGSTSINMTLTRSS